MSSSRGADPSPVRVRGGSLVRDGRAVGVLVEMTRRVALLILVLLASVCAPASSDNASVQRAFAERRSNVEVTAAGTVTRVLADETGLSGTHQRFVILLVGSSQTVLVDNNVSIGRRAPVGLSDEVVAHGEYVWNEQGGLIHFTHHDPAGTHEGGWIELRGIRYE